MELIISLPLKFSKPLPKVVGNKDYTELENLLKNIDSILDNNFDMKAINYFLNKNSKLKNTEKNSEKALTAFRTIILQSIINRPFRKMSIELAHSELYKWFVKIDTFASNEIQVPSKSSIDRYEKIFDKNFIDELNIDLIKLSMKGKNNSLKLKHNINIDDLFADTTCIETNIHYPVDWKLLLDGVKTLTKAIEIIRKHGIKYRIKNPKYFRTEMNKLSIAMAQSSRVKLGKKKRKYFFRKMKKITKRIMKHAEKYLELMINEENNINLTKNEIKNIENRIKSVLSQLPTAIKNAHERIIGERKVLNINKIFSLYEKETQILVRKKSGKEIEFGNKLLLVENEIGLIIDYDFMKHQENDSKLIFPMIERLNENFKERKIKSITTDKGFTSNKNKKKLKEEKIYNGMCPRDINELTEKFKNIKFKKKQKRRAQTEGRISIFKNIFLGDVLKSKGFNNRERVIALKIFAHNLWVISRLPQIIKKEIPEKLIA